MNQPPAGWYANPDEAGKQRWWDGGRWTEHIRGAHEGNVGPSAVSAPVYGAEETRANPAARTGFGLGLASLFLFGVPLVGLLLCLSAVVVSAIALGPHTPEAAKSDKVYAIIGLVLGIVYTLMVLVWIVTGRM